MSRIYDNWERLVAAVVKREQIWKLCHSDSLSSSFSSVSFDVSSSFSRRFSFEIPTEHVIGQTPDDGYLHHLPVPNTEELKEKTNNFGLKALIGECTYGRMYFAQLDSGDNIAVVKLDDLSSDSNVEFLTQVSLMSSYKHKNIIEFLGYCLEGNIQTLAYDFGNMGCLRDILHEGKGPVLDWMQRVRIAVDAARGLEYLHENSIIHRDIRSSNVLLFDQDYKAKIAHFSISNHAIDIAARLHKSARAPLAVDVYHAPEYAMTKQWTEKSDVYSFGVVLIELLTGRKPVDHAMPLGHQSLVTWATPRRMAEENVKKYIDPKLKGEYPLKGVVMLTAVAAKCVNREPGFRPDMAAVVKALQQLIF